MIAFDAIGLFDRGFGPYILPVTPPDGPISPLPEHPLSPKVMGKAPGRLTSSGWVPVTVYDLKQRCHDYKTAKLWQETWGSNVGFVASDGYVFIDNDQGEEFSRAIRQVMVDLGVSPFRRFVQAPKHKRDAFLMRVLNFVGEPAEIANRNLTFRKGTAVAKIQIIARGLQAVIAGTHQGTRCPYVWDCDINNLEQDVPVLSDKKFEDTIRNLMGELSDLGWTLGGAGASGTVVQGPWRGGVAIATPPPPDPAAIMNALNEVRDLLAYIPNREVPPGEAPTKVDLYLDDYQNYVDVAYRMAGQLGRFIAETSDAHDIWVDWANGRQQQQNPEDIWRSVLNQPTWSYGELALEKLIQELGVRPKPGYPPIDPNDPLLKAPPTPIWDKMHDEWALFVPKSGFVYVPNGTFVPRQAFIDIHTDVTKALTKELRPGHKGKPPSAADLFCGQPDKGIVSRFDYAPGENPASPLYDDPNHAGACVFNRWEPTDIQPRPIAVKQIQPWLDHVEFVLGSQEERERFTRWCAFVAQCPKEKPQWHYLILSVPGLGKDTMLVPVRLAIGTKNTKEIDAAQLNDSFTDPFETKLLIVNELRQAQNKDARMLWNRLKQAMASPPDQLYINIKNIPRYPIPNRLAIILLANDFNPLFLEADDRRLHVRNQRHILPRDKGYYAQLIRWLDQGGKEDAAAYLLSYPLTAADKAEFLGTAPSSPDKAVLADMNLDPIEDAITDIMQEAQDGKRSLVTELDPLVEAVAAKGVRWAPAGKVRACLMDLEKRGKGAGRVRINPSHPNRCGVINSKGTSARLWYLGPVPDGREWKDLGDLEVLALWKGKGLPPSAKVLGFPSTTKDDPKADEPI